MLGTRYEGAGCRRGLEEWVVGVGVSDGDFRGGSVSGSLMVVEVVVEVPEQVPESGRDGNCDSGQVVSPF